MINTAHLSCGYMKVQIRIVPQHFFFYNHIPHQCYGVLFHPTILHYIYGHPPRTTFIIKYLLGMMHSLGSSGGDDRVEMGAHRGLEDVRIVEQ